MIVFATTDPTDLADALVQNARAPARFAIGALAAFRLRAAARPGVADAQHGPAGAGRRRRAATRWPGCGSFASTAFALLVGAIRRGTRLAMAMDARGFDAGMPRTAPAGSGSRRADAALVVGRGARLAAGALTVSVVLGTFRPLID